MVNKQKRKGSRWERDAVKLLNKHFPGTWVRNPMSGALGTNMNMPVLKGDLRGKYGFLSRPFVAEAKVGYGGVVMQIQKEWFDKVRLEAEEAYAVPIVLLKFEKATKGSKHIVAMDFETWDDLLSEIESLYDEINKLYDEQE